MGLDTLLPDRVGHSNESNWTVNSVNKEYARIGVIFGGRSSEHEVSLQSAATVMSALDEAGYDVAPIGIDIEGRWITSDPVLLLNEAKQSRTNGTESTTLQQTDSWDHLPTGTVSERLPSVDVVFPVLHGPYGEDGTIQGMLEMARIPYVGCGVLSSAAAMDKIVAKKLFSMAGLNQTRSLLVWRRVWRQNPNDVIDDIEAQVEYPLFVKPANMGSSVGISRAKDRQQLSSALDEACRYDTKIVIEAAVPNAREIEVSVLGNDEPIVSMPGEVIPHSDFYDYNAKYVDDKCEYLIPAPISRHQTSEIRNMAVRAFQAVDGSGLARVDFLLDDDSGVIYLNELNTMPGFTRYSMYPKLWEASGIPYSELVSRLVDLAIERFDDRKQNSTGR